MDPTDAMVMGLASFKVALVFHIAGALTLFVAVGMQVFVTLFLRGASSLGQIKLAAKIVRGVPPLFTLASAVVVASGSYLGYLDWHYDEPVGWIAASLIMFLLIGIVGAASGRTYSRKLASELARAHGKITPDLAILARSKSRIVALALSVFSLLAILIVMIFQPVLEAVILIYVLAPILALIITLIPMSAGRTASDESLVDYEEI